MPAKLFNCFLCGYSINKLQYLCDACYEHLPWNTHACEVCSLTLPYNYSSATCAKCLIIKPSFRIIAPFRYDKLIAHIIKAIKYHSALEMHALLAELMVNHLLTQGLLEKVDVIVPVPLFPKRQIWRGFNQAAELAKAINDILGIEVDFYSCNRVKNTPSQTKYGALRRRRNLHGAFIANSDFSGKRVVILDDVVTTGATISALAEVVYAKGALAVEVWVVARA